MQFNNSQKKELEKKINLMNDSNKQEVLNEIFNFILNQKFGKVNLIKVDLKQIINKLDDLL